jgi:hypothetical protein
MLKNMLVIIPLLPYQWHLRTWLKHEHTTSASLTTDWRNKLINCICSRRDTLCHGTETPAQQNCWQTVGLIGLGPYFSPLPVWMTCQK